MHVFTIHPYLPLRGSQHPHTRPLAVFNNPLACGKACFFSLLPSPNLLQQTLLLISRLNFAILTTLNELKLLKNLENHQIITEYYDHQHYIPHVQHLQHYDLKNKCFQLLH